VGNEGAAAAVDGAGALADYGASAIRAAHAAADPN